MRAFEVYLNDTKLCVAGVGANGVLNAMIVYVGGGGRDEVTLRVGGLISPQEEHVLWRKCALRTGDQIKVRVVETELVDVPTKRYHFKPANEMRAKKRYIREMAKKFGWTLTTSRSKRS